MAEPAAGVGQWTCPDAPGDRAVAAGVLYPFTGILLSPMIAGATMSASSLLVIGNALRLRHADLSAT